MCQSQTVEPASRATYEEPSGVAYLGELSSLAAFSLDLMQSDSLIHFDIPTLPFQLKSYSTTSSVMFTETDYLNIYHNSLGIFCKAENKLSAHAPVQFRMRLGNLDTVNKMEGK